MKESIIASPFLRCATPADLETVLAWLPDAASCRRWAGPAVRFPATADSLWEDIGADGQNTFGFCCTREETLLGLGQLLPRPGGVTHLARLMVAPHCRGQGLGRQLCAALLRKGTDTMGAQAFTLRVYPDNVVAVALYHSLGFTEVTDDCEASGSVLMSTGHSISS